MYEHTAPVIDGPTIDAIISPKYIDERDLATRLLFNILPLDLVLMDRDYPGWWLFALILSSGAHFRARIDGRPGFSCRFCRNTGVWMRMPSDTAGLHKLGCT